MSCANIRHTHTETRLCLLTIFATFVIRQKDWIFLKSRPFCCKIVVSVITHYLYCLWYIPYQYNMHMYFQLLTVHNGKGEYLTPTCHSVGGSNIWHDFTVHNSRGQIGIWLNHEKFGHIIAGVIMHKSFAAMKPVHYFNLPMPSSVLVSEAHGFISCECHVTFSRVFLQDIMRVSYSSFSCYYIVP